MEKIYIYTLTDPIDNMIKYVGKTNNLERRMLQHICYTVNSTTKVGNWLRKLKNLGLRPIMEVIDECCNETWENTETYWISQMRTWGFDLKNHALGGVSGTKSIEPIYPSCRIVSKETRDKISKIHKGKTVPKEVSEKIAFKLRGRKHTDSHNLKIGIGTSQALRNRDHSRVLRQYTKSNNLISEYNSIAEAAELTNILKSAIGNNVINLSNSAGGYIWKWENK